MKKTNLVLYSLFLFFYFNTLNAGIYSIFPISGLGFASYMLLFLFLLSLKLQEGFYVRRYNVIYYISFIWLFILLLTKKLGSFTGLYEWFLGGLIISGYSYVEKPEKEVSFFLLISLLFALFFSYFEMITGFHLSMSRYEKGYVSLQGYHDLFVPTYYFTNENDFASFITLSFCFLRSVRHHKRFFYDAFLLFPVLFSVFITGSRLCLLGIFTYYFFLLITCLKGWIKKFVLISLGVCTPVICIKILLPKILNMLSNNSLKSEVVRMNLLLVSLKNIFIQGNIWGLGPAAFPKIIGGNSNTGTIVDPHNWFVELGVEVGLFFLILYLLFVVCYLFKESNKYLKAFFLVFIICSFCSSRFSTGLWNWFFLAFFIKRFFLLRKSFI